jgi:hypothetical protein
MAAANGGGGGDRDGVKGDENVELRQPGLVSNSRNVRKMTKRREKQLTRTVLLICVSFFVCFLPSALIGECGEFVNKDMPRVHSLKMFSVLLKRPF